MVRDGIRRKSDGQCHVAHTEHNAFSLSQITILSSRFFDSDILNV